jgi:hypothetical protein
MKRISLSKSLRTFGLMAILSAVVATTLQQPIQAQNKGGKVQAKTPTACVPLAPGTSFYDLQGLEFSPKQQVEYKQISDIVTLKSEALSKRLRKVMSKGYLVTEYPGTTDDKIRKEIEAAASDATAADGIVDRKKVKALNKKYAQYAKFYIEPKIVFTQAQITERNKINSDLEEQTLSILTPEQQKVFRANLVIKRGLEACDTTWNKADG